MILTKEHIKAKREAIKTAFPAKEGWKFSITSSASRISCRIMQTPVRFVPAAFPEYGFNTHSRYLTETRNGHILKQIKGILEAGNEAYGDAHDTTLDHGRSWDFYTDFGLGKWDKPYTYVGKPAPRLSDATLTQTLKACSRLLYDLHRGRWVVQVKQVECDLILIIREGSKFQYKAGRETTYAFSEANTLRDIADAGIRGDRDEVTIMLNLDRILREAIGDLGLFPVIKLGTKENPYVFKTSI